MSEATKQARPCAAYYLATVLSVINLLSIIAAAALTVTAVAAPHILPALVTGAKEQGSNKGPAGTPYDSEEGGADIEQIRGPGGVINMRTAGADPEELDLRDLDSLLRSLQGEGGQEESGSPIYNIIAPRSGFGSIITPALFVPFGMFAIMTGLFMQVILAVARGLLLAFPPTRPRRAAVRPVRAAVAQ